MNGASCRTQSYETPAQGHQETKTHRPAERKAMKIQRSKKYWANKIEHEGTCDVGAGSVLDRAEICPCCRVKESDHERINHLELHLASGRSVDYYLSTEGHCYKLADKYDHRVPYHRTLRLAIDASRQNAQAQAQPPTATHERKGDKQ
jgi:hypothetical protein